MKRASLRWRLFAVVAAAVVPLAVMGAVSLYFAYQQQREQMGRLGLDVARAISTAVDAELRQTISVLQTLGDSAELVQGDLPAFHARARRERDSNPNWIAIVLTDTSGNVLMHTEVPYGQAPPPLVEAESHARVAAGRVPVVGYLARGPTGKYAFPVRVPLRRDGVTRHVLSAILKPEAILAMLMGQSVPKDWYVAVADAKGLRVARTRASEQSVGTPFSPTLVDMIRTGGADGEGETRTSEGEPVFTAYSRHPTTGWATAVGAPVRVLEAAALASVYTLAAGALLSVALGLIAAYFLSLRILAPITRLRLSASGLARGGAVVPADSEIAEIQEVETALAAAAGELERSRAEREDLLEREKRARATAESANKAKDEFLAMLGHELRNPLAAISNAASLLESGRLAPDKAEHMQGIISRQVTHLTRLMDDLLDAGRALMGKIVLRPQELDLAELARQSIATLRASGRLRAHAIHETFQSVRVMADPIRMDQVIANLVVNAVKYTQEPGNIHVDVAREGGEAVVRVRDDGIGLSPELAARAFDLFVQGDRELDRSQGGLGIGLTLVRRLAELHGGTASVQSSGAGKGSEFTIRIPALDAPGVRVFPDAAVVCTPRRILVVEDNADGRESLRAILELAGHEVEAVDNGVAAVARVQSGAFDVALVDVGLPGMDGHEVARRIRAGIMKPPYLVALTGYGTPEDRESALQAGFDEHVAKPVNPDTLAAVIARSGPQESSK